MLRWVFWVASSVACCALSGCFLDATPLPTGEAPAPTGGTGGLGGGGAGGQTSSSSTTTTGTGATGGGSTSSQGGTGGTGGQGGSGGMGGAPTNDNCPGTSVSVPPYADVVVQGDTTGATDGTAFSVCGGGSAPDLIYQVIPLATGVLTATISVPSSFKGFLRFHDTCEGAELDCTNDTLSIIVEKDVPIFMVVDGHEPKPEGTFTVYLNLTSCGNGIIEGPEACDDGGSGSGQCTDSCNVICDVGDSAATDSDVYLDPVTHHCYLQVYTPNSNWDKAREDCMAWGGDLAALSTTQEITTLAPTISFTFEDIWLGGIDSDGNSQFEWVTGEPWVYINKQAPWSTNEPSGNEFCVEIYKNTKLNDQGCDASQNYLCERAPVGEVGPPP